MEDTKIVKAGERPARSKIRQWKPISHFSGTCDLKLSGMGWRLEFHRDPMWIFDTMDLDAFQTQEDLHYFAGFLKGRFALVEQSEQRLRYEVTRLLQDSELSSTKGADALAQRIGALQDERFYLPSRGLQTGNGAGPPAPPPLSLKQQEYNVYRARLVSCWRYLEDRRRKGSLECFRHTLGTAYATHSLCSWAREEGWGHPNARAAVNHLLGWAETQEPRLALRVVHPDKGVNKAYAVFLLGGK